MPTLKPAFVRPFQTLVLGVLFCVFLTPVVFAQTEVSTLSGSLISTNQTTTTLTLRPSGTTGAADTAFSITGDTVIKRGEELLSFADLNAGQHLGVDYHTDSGVNVAEIVTILVPAS